MSYKKYKLNHKITKDLLDGELLWEYSKHKLLAPVCHNSHETTKPIPRV